MKTDPNTRCSDTELRNAQAQSKAQEVRPIEICVFDVTSPPFKAEAHRQSLVVAMSANHAEDQAFIDAISIPIGDQ